MTVFDQVRADCARVLVNAEYVTFSRDALDRLAESLIADFRAGVEMEHSEAHHVLHQGIDTLAFFLILDTINFGSGYFPWLRKLPDSSGYFTVAARLKQHCIVRGIPSPLELASITPTDCAEIFDQDPHTDETLELMTLFARALNDLGAFVQERYSGHYEQLLGCARNSAENVVRALSAMPFYRDVESYDGNNVHFYKRAQIFVQDIAIAEPNHPLTQFSDIDSLTVFADNVIPYVLRCERVITLDPELSAQVDAEAEVESGSLQEIELRASAVVAGQLISERLAQDGISAPERMVDFLLWNRGQALKKSCPYKRHRTKSVYY